MSAAEMFDERRTHQRLRELTNGGWDDMDPTTRRCIVLIADEIDHIHASVRQTRKEHAEQSAATQREVADTRKTMIALMSAIIVAVIGSGIANILLR